MSNFMFSLNATLPVFLVIVLGWFLMQKKMFNENFVDIINKFVFKVSLPVLLFKDIATTPIRDAFDPKFVIFCMVGTTIMFMGIWALTSIFMKDKSMVGAFTQASARGSAAVLGIAFVQNIYGNSGMAPLMIIGSVPLYNIMAVVVLTVIRPERGRGNGALIRKTLHGIITNPIIVGILTGVVWSVLKLPMPVILEKTVKNVAVLATPLGLMAMGASIEFKGAFENMRPVILAVLLKLVILAGIFLPIAVTLGFRTEKLIAILVMLGSATTVSSYVMARNMGHKGVLTSSVVMLTTLLSAFTLTGWLYLLKVQGLV